MAEPEGAPTQRKATRTLARLLATMALLKSSSGEASHDGLLVGREGGMAAMRHMLGGDAGGGGGGGRGGRGGGVKDMGEGEVRQT